MSFFDLEILNQLNEPQRQVVQTTEGAVLVLAGAGSGKTRSIIYRVAWLIKVKKIKPWNLLIVTFTNKAAKELKERLSLIFGNQIHLSWVGTFHSICLRIIRNEIGYLTDFSAGFTIFDRDDQVALVKKIFKQFDLKNSEFTPSVIISVISKSKTQMITPDDFLEINSPTPKNRLFKKVYKTYDDYMKRNNAMDFDDILLKCVELFSNHPEILQKYGELFKYIMVDEYQDTNYVQFQLIHLLSGINKNLCVVGDDDQSIYGWRGANIKNILQFKEDYPDAEIIKLEQNYRSTIPILALANDVISKNKNRHDKELWTNLSSEKIPDLIAHHDEYAEARFIVEDILDYVVKQKMKFSDCVILYRTNSQSRVLENALNQNFVPYIIYGGINFYQRTEIKDMLAWLKLISNPRDNISFLRICNIPPRGFGSTSLSRLTDFSLDENLSLFETLYMVDKLSFLNKKSKAGLTDFFNNIMRWQENAEQLKITEIIKDIIACYDLTDYYKKEEKDIEDSRNDNITELIAAATEFEESFYKENEHYPQISEFLQQISLQTDFDTNEKKEDRDSVRLMTMHNAKGLEFDNVYISGLEDGLIPHFFSQMDYKEVEEERRLFYVAITRAKRFLQLHYAHTRRMADQVKNTSPSRFLKDIKAGLLEEKNISFWDVRPPEKNDQLSYKSYKKPAVITENEKYFKIGQKIMHQNHGIGVILNVEGVGKDAKLTISFNNGTMKKIIGNFVEIVYE